VAELLEREDDLGKLVEVVDEAAAGRGSRCRSRFRWGRGARWLDAAGGGDLIELPPPRRRRIEPPRGSSYWTAAMRYLLLN
jgi:hypothetical protein